MSKPLHLASSRNRPDTGASTLARLLAGLVALGALMTPVTAQLPDFQAAWEEAEGAYSIALALADIDGDSDIDAWVADQDSDSRLWLNDGTGNFVAGARPPVSPTSIQFGLFDNDPHPDAFITRLFNTNQLWINDGSGSFSNSGQSIGASGVWGYADVGDVDGDGDLDVVAPTDSISAENRLFLNDGAGTFTDAAALGMYWSRRVVLADVDGDNDLDAFFANNGGNRLWLNDGSGGFTESAQILGTGSTFGAEFGDLDGDNDLDLFIANGTNNGTPNRVLLNDGSGTFTDSGQSIGNAYSVSVTLIDSDSDGDLDAYVGNNRAVADKLWLNDGSGNFSDSGQALSSGGAWGLAAGLLNADLFPDVFTANNAGPDTVWLGSAGGALNPSGQVLSSFAAASADIADIDGDGDRDAVVGVIAGLTRVLRNDGAGNLQHDLQWLSNGEGNNVSATAIADFDGDGDNDFFSATSGYSGAADLANRVWLNDGTGSFSDSGQRLGATSSYSLALGDVDGNGSIDVFEGTNANDVLWLNDGAGNFTADPQTFGSGNAFAVVLGDLDGNGSLDLVVGNSNADNLVFLNNGSGGFTDTGQLLGGVANTVSLALGDVDGDGDRDLLEGLDGGNRVWLNDGSGNFTDSGQSLGNSRSEEIHGFDADDDGDLDIWTSNGRTFSGQANKVWINDGSGVFTDSGLSLGLSKSVASAVGDLDGDSALDVFVANGFGDHRVWISQAVGSELFVDGFESGDTSAWSSSVP